MVAVALAGHVVVADDAAMGALLGAEAVTAALPSPRPSPIRGEGELGADGSTIRTTLGSGRGWTLLDGAPAGDCHAAGLTAVVAAGCVAPGVVEL